LVMSSFNFVAAASVMVIMPSPFYGFHVMSVNRIGST